MKVVWIAVCTILILASVDQIRARKDTCSRVRCGYSKICRVVKGRALCICRRGCPKILRPVCGSDGKTYDNECLLRVARCVQNKFIKVIHKGPCRNPCAVTFCGSGAVCTVKNGKAVCVCNSACPFVYKPVCGSDGKTYSNECNLNSARCKQKKFIRVIHEGPCKNPCSGKRCRYGGVCKVLFGKAVCVCRIACTKIYRPVCGSDRKTYSNECMLKRARCQQQKLIWVSYKGPCKKNPCSGKRCRYGGVCKVLFGKAVCVCRIACTKIYRPVCGSDRKTYSNECMLKRARCQQQKLIWVSYKGRCKKNPCSGKRCRYGGVCKVQFGKAACVCHIACIAIYRPVCGSDRKTYSNECVLKRARCQQQKLIWVSYKGRCKKNPCFGKRCGYGRVCKVLLGKAVCVCRIACTKIYRPVCGSDRKTYTNECALKRARCLQRKLIWVSYKGPCKKW